MIDEQNRETKTIVEAHLYEQQDKLKEAIVASQKILSEYLTPDSGVNEQKTISLLLDILDDSNLVKLIKELQ